MKSLNIAAMLLLFFTALLFSCGGTETERIGTYTEEVVDGVKHVHNIEPLWGIESKVGLEFVQKIGEEEGPDKNLLLYRANGVAVNKAGEILIVDGGNKRIQVFSENGEYLRTIGRQGDGPGEFSSPSKINFRNDGSFIVSESMQRFHIFDKEEKYVKTVTLKKEEPKQFGPLIINISSMDVTSDGLFIESVETVPIDGEAVIMPLIKLFDLEGNFINDFVEPKKHDILAVTRYDNDINFTIDRDENIIVTFTTQNRIEKYSKDGELLMKISRKLNFEEKEPVYLEELRSYTQYPSMISCGIDIDDKGRIWVCTYIKQPDEIVDGSSEARSKYTRERKSRKDLCQIQVFDQDGVLLCNVPVYLNIRNFRIFGDRIYFITWDGIDVHIYRILER
ncbi:6-bladed beta-propeller [candidate division KSB1 bacterium]